MPPSQNPTQDQTTAISTFADDLLNHIAQPGPSSQLHVPCNIVETLDRCLDQSPLFSCPVPVTTRHQLDERGVELWNECTPLIARSQGDERSGILAKVRTFAFALLDCVALRHGPGNSRVLDLSLKTARTCLENNQLDLVLKILKIAAVRLDALEKSGTEVDSAFVCSVTTEYYMLRIHLAWLQERPDIADHLFSKVPHGVSEKDGRIVLETCYRVGMLALSNGEYDTANIWLGRAMDSSDGFRGGSNPVLKDLRLLVLHSFVRVNSHIDSDCSRDNLSRALDSLKAEYGNVFAALILRLEILSKDDEPNYQEFFEVLRAAVQTTVLTDENLKLVLYYIQNLRNWSLELSVEVFKELLLEHLAPSGKTLWMEQSIVTLIWMLTTSVSPLKNSFDVIADIVKSLAELGTEPLSEEATHTSLVLIWRNIASARSNVNQHDAERWCTLVLEQPIFQNCSQTNKDKLQRKSISSALEASNTSHAREILSLVDQDSRSDPLMLYLIYKLSLLDEDFQLGFETLDKLGTVEKSSLLACAAEAQRLGKRRQAINIFQHIIATLDNCGERTHVPALIRSTICLLAKELEDCKTRKKRAELLDEICHAFEIAWNEVDKQESSNDAFLKDDLEWFYQNAYDLALKYSKSSSSGPIMRLLDASTKLATKYQDRTTPDEQIDINEHYIHCDFLKMIKITSEARIQADPVQKRNNYQTTRDTIQNFRTRFTTQLQQTGKNLKASSSGQNDMTEKYRIILSLDFEAAIYLQHWSNLSSLIEETRGIATEKISAIFMNAILASDVPVREIIRVVKAIICTNHKSFPGSTLPRYLRVLFQLTLSSSPSPSSVSNSAPSFNSAMNDGNTNDNTPIAETVLDQILFLARKSHSTIHSNTGQQSPSNTSPGTSPPYPREELEWLASTTFNRAVDFYRVSADAECKRWAGKAIEVAELVDRGSKRESDHDGVGLAGLLRGKLMVLGLD